MFTPAVEVNSNVDYFSVLKCDSDIWMVFKCISCGVNEHDSLQISGNQYQIQWQDFYSLFTELFDLDISEIFLYFPLHKDLQIYSDVDVTMFRRELTDKVPTSVRSDKRLSDVWKMTWFGCNHHNT